jgi:NAD(P)-dependent dehydrogenase (short-subunit alcohol dehydrogenase family)
MRLKDRVVIVTGAARGIGQEYCLALAREGAKISAADILPCEETVAHVQRVGGDALTVAVDVTDEQSTQSMAAKTLERFGRIDVLVNNAALYGGLKLTPFEQIPEPQWDQVMAVNVKGTWLFRALVPKWYTRRSPTSQISSARDERNYVLDGLQCGTDQNQERAITPQGSIWQVVGPPLYQRA